MKMVNRERKGIQQNMDKGRISVTAVVLCSIAALVLIPIVIASAYTFFHADDFSHANAVGVFGGNIIELFVVSLKFSKRMYLVWQGTYTSMFLQAFLSPLNGFGLAQLRIVMVFNTLLFIISLVVIIDSVCKCCNIQGNDKLLIFVLAAIGIFGFSSWTEVFYWFSGAVSYSFPLSFCLLGIAIALKSRSVKGCVVASVFMFLASGGTLAVAGTGCFILLSICIIKAMANQLKRTDCIVFGVAVTGALMNALAPGNYVRHSMIDNSGLHLKLAVGSAIFEVLYTIEELLYNTPFLLIIIVAVMIGVRISRDSKQTNQKSLFMIILLSIITPFVTCFPVCLAYSGRDYFPNRCKFIEIVVVVIALLVIAIDVGHIFNEWFESWNKKEIIAALAFIVILIPNINSAWKLSQLVPFQMWDAIVKDTYKEYFNEVRNIYQQIEDDTNEDVFIYEKPEDIPDFPVVDMSEDMSSWINQAIAVYYKKQSVQFVSEPVCVQSDGQKNIRISPDMIENPSEYVSIFKVDNATQQTEVIQILHPLESNIVISAPKGENGKVGIYSFADKEGRIQIGMKEIEY